MIDVMVDLETMGTSANAPIVAIGATVFGSALHENEEFYVKISLASAVKSGAVIDPTTVSWWLQQSDEARAIFKPNNDTKSLKDALFLFDVWLNGLKTKYGDILLWGNGASFDNTILSTTYARLEQPQPWLFWNDRCYRTLKALNPLVQLPERTGTHHNALDDAKYQAQCANEIFKQGAVK